MLGFLLSLPRNAKKTVLLTSDIVVLSLSAFIACWLTQLQPWPAMMALSTPLLFTLPLTLLVFARLGLYRAVIRFIDEHILSSVILGVAMHSGLLALLLALTEQSGFNRWLVVYGLLCLLGCGCSRIVARMLLFPRSTAQKHKQPVLIYGAGSSGRQLAQALLNGEQYQPVAFVDDDPKLQRSTILGLPVGCPEQIVSFIESKRVQRVLLAIPSASRCRRTAVLDSLASIAIPVQTIPGMADIVNGHMRIDDLQDVRIEDLLGRDPVAPIDQLLHANIKGKVVMVTGAGGSIGAELCRQIIRNNPKALVLFEISEYALYSIHQELLAWVQLNQSPIDVFPIIGNVQSKSRVSAVLKKYQVATLYHAAAYKHVPMVEFNVIEGVKNNVFGTWRCAEAAIDARVETFVLVSTDKAVRPTNLMGATKRLAELVLQGLAAKQQVTRFCMVRFGNVLGSSGSVVPLFREQIRNGGPVTVTHPDIYRYFMTIPEAAQLVIQAGALGKAGDVFVLDMGEPVRIVDLALRMIHLMGLTVKDAHRPDGDIEIQFTGLRPGEKLYEELLIGDKVQHTIHPRICAAQECSMPWHDVKNLLLQLQHHCEASAVTQVVALIKEAPTGLHHHQVIRDLVDLDNKTFTDVVTPIRTPLGQHGVVTSFEQPLPTPSLSSG